MSVLAKTAFLFVLDGVISQVFSTLRPIDLLTLARTSKDLRRLLMSRKSLWVWITARRNAGETRVPDPPEDMSEPAWALLLFGPAVCSVRSPVSSRIVLQADVMSGMFYQERHPGRLCPSSSFVRRL